MIVVGLLFLFLFCCSIPTTISSDLNENSIPFQRRKFSRKDNSTKTLVIYSGPTEPFNEEVFLDENFVGRQRMYHDNFRFFLRNAISEEMEGVDFIFVLTKSAMGSYSNVVSYLTGLSQTQFRFRIRKNADCYDMESYFRTLKETDTSSYDNFIFLNCGILGPFIPDPYRVAGFPWPLLFTSYLSEKVKLVGLTINCAGMWAPQMHVQSMLWATDQIGLSVILKEGCLYDCHLPHGRQSSQFAGIVYHYELCLTRAIRRKGFQVQAVNSIQSSLTEHWKLHTPIEKNNCSDYWLKDSLPNDRNIHPFETAFFKVSRFSTKEVSYLAEKHLKYSPFPRQGNIDSEIRLTGERDGQLSPLFLFQIQETTNHIHAKRKKGILNINSQILRNDVIGPKRKEVIKVPKINKANTPQKKETKSSWLFGFLGF